MFCINNDVSTNTQDFPLKCGTMCYDENNIQFYFKILEIALVLV